MKAHKYIRNYLTHPWQQLKYSAIIGLFFSVLTLITNLRLYLNYSQISLPRELDSNTLYTTQLVLKELLIESTIETFIFTFLISLITVTLATHRFLGPLISIKRYIEDTIDGKNPKALKIRRSDELHELVELINKLTKK